jgi:perosamine synthetase
MQEGFIPVNIPRLNKKSREYVIDCLDSGWISSSGSYVKEFESGIAKIVKSDFGVAVTNGSTALDLAIASLELKSGDEVILPNFTIISCLNQILRIGAVPVFVDADPVTWNMDTTLIENSITSRTVGIMVVHIYGLPTDLDPVIELCSKYNLKLIEDCSEALGTLYKNEPCGSFGDISTFSFFANKIISTGEGGMLVTSNDTYRDKLQYLRNLHFNEKSRFIHEGIGWNARMTNLQAALGCGQLDEIETNIQHKRKVATQYREGLSQFTELLNYQPPCVDYSINDYWVFGIQLRENSGWIKSQIMDQLKNFGIETRPFFQSLHSQPLFNSRFKQNHFPVSDSLSKNGFYIPSGNGIQEWQVEKVIESLIKVLKK